VLLLDVAATSSDVSSTSSRLTKVAHIADLLRRAAPDGALVAVIVSWLSGELRQRQIGVGWAALRSRPPPAPHASLTVGGVDATFSDIGAVSGKGAQARRAALLNALFAAATDTEQAFLLRLLGGELRQGALAGVMADAVAVATGIPRSVVDRATMLRGDARVVAEAALREGEAGMAQFALEVGRPVGPMLASPSPSLEEAMAKLGRAAVDWKLDGARIQVHRDGDDVVIASRSLDDLTARLPEVVAAARALPSRRFILDGEAISFRDDGRPEPFQVTSSRIASGAPGVVPVFFDILHLDDEDLLDAPLARRAEALEAAVPDAAVRIARVVTDDLEVAREHFEAALAAGHEGVVVKDLDAPYAAGRRGAGWLKVKPRHTLDLVVLAAEWGHGRRRGWLSNLHLGARAPDGDGYVMLGKTFKGLTDELLAWQTEKLKALAVEERGITVFVKPELVVEIAFDGVQTSPRYPGGVALRFARVLRYREDKPASEADDLNAVLALQR
jgi:DNA ligase-1